MGKAVNRARVARWRAKKINQGYKTLTVYLPAEALKMIDFLHGHYQTTKSVAKLIELPLKALYEKDQRNSKKRGKHYM